MPWLRRRRPAPEAPPSPEAISSPEAAAELEEARRAREESERARREVRARWPEVEQVTAALREHRQRNGFRAMFERALLRGGEEA